MKPEARAAQEAVEANLARLVEERTRTQARLAEIDDEIRRSRIFLGRPPDETEPGRQTSRETNGEFLIRLLRETPPGLRTSTILERATAERQRMAIAENPTKTIANELNRLKLAGIAYRAAGGFWRLRKDKR